ncbi:MAG: HEAT repeat domain-containing protein, partial [Desulfobacterium sp.]
FNGGLFFTFTLGAGLSAIAFVCAWLWYHIFSRNKTILCSVSLFWLGCVITLNFNGPLFLISGILLLLPFAVFLFTLRMISLRSSHSFSRQSSFHCLYLHLTLLLILAIAGNSLVGGSPFTHIRDTFLLSNPAGMVINDFYYRYTLHAARVFKRLDQRVVNTCVIDAGDDEILYNRLEKVLVGADFFPVNHGAGRDLTVKNDNGLLTLGYCGHGILECSVEDFLAKPLVWLEQFSLNTDRHGLFRKMIYVSLLVGLPIFIYTLCCSFMLMLLGRMGISEKKGNISAPILVVLGGIVLLGILAYYSTVSGSIQPNVLQSLSSPHVRVRLAGLKNIGKHKLNIVDFQGYEGLLKSPHVAERYWAVRALASARGRNVQQRLLSLLNDPHPNVVCQALYALGKRRDKRVIPEIIHLITTSDHWYVQWYGYRAVKQLGWKQIALK